MKKSVLFFVLLFVLGLAAVSCVFPQEGPAVLKVYYQPTISGAPLIIAMEEGYFKDEGIQVDFVRSQDTAVALLSFLQGGIDVLSGPVTAGFYNLAAQGKEIKLVASAASYKKGNAFSGLMLKGLPKDIAGNTAAVIRWLKGKRVALPIMGSMPHYFIDTLLERHGMSTADVEFVVMSFPMIKEGLQKGFLDAGFLVEPFLSFLKKDQAFSFLSFENEFPDVSGAYIIYGERLLRKDPSLGRKFMAAYLKGCRQYDQGKTPRNIEILAKYIELSPQMLKSMSWPAVAPEDLLRTKPLEDYQEWLLKKGFLTGKIDVRLLTDDRFLKDQ